MANSLYNAYNEFFFISFERIVYILSDAQRKNNDSAVEWLYWKSFMSSDRCRFVGRKIKKIYSRFDRKSCDCGISIILELFSNFQFSLPLLYRDENLLCTVRLDPFSKYSSSSHLNNHSWLLLELGIYLSWILFGGFNTIQVVRVR